MVVAEVLATKDEAVSQRKMVPYQEFLETRKSVYDRNWFVQTSWLLSWGLKQLGIFEQSTAVKRLPTERFVIMHNIEVHVI